MTSIAMSAGMLPSAMGVGEGGSFRAPMAIAVIGGIIVSTVLSLLVVPSFFLIMDDLSRLLGRIFSRFVGRKEEKNLISPNEVAQQTQRHGRTLHDLEKRLSSLENGEDTSSSSQHSGLQSDAQAGHRVMRLPPMAAE
jgi:hypothetical protein